MLRIYTHNLGSEGLSNLRTALNPFISALHTEISNNFPEVACSSGRAILASDRPEAPAFRGGRRIVLNWGNSTPLTGARSDSNFYINTEAAVGRATNKKTFFETIHSYNNDGDTNEDDEVSIPEWTTTKALAERWHEEGSVVYARTSLQGHSGQGIVVAGAGGQGSVATAPLYTKGITGARREYRVHVYKGKVIHVQTKRRRSDAAINEDVRNLDGGWVFAVSNVTLSDQVRNNAINAVDAIGLDFGAVDIIAKGRAGQETESYVLEINTAPGQRGDTTINRYAKAIIDDVVNYYFHHALSLSGSSNARTTVTKLAAIFRTPAIVSSIMEHYPILAVEADGEGDDGGSDMSATATLRSTLFSGNARVSSAPIAARMVPSFEFSESSATASATRVEAVPQAARPTAQVRASRLSGTAHTSNYYAVCTYTPRQGAAVMTSLCEVDVSRGVAWIIGIDAPFRLDAVTLVSEVILS